MTREDETSKIKQETAQLKPKSIIAGSGCVTSSWKINVELICRFTVNIYFFQANNVNKFALLADKPKTLVSSVVLKEDDDITASNLSNPDICWRLFKLFNVRQLISF